jgi:hypothetical protein
MPRPPKPGSLLVLLFLPVALACGRGSSSSGPTHEFFWDPMPPSTLLPAGATSVPFTVNTNTPASCGYMVGHDADFPAMAPFETGQGGTVHGVTFLGLDPTTTVVNDVYVRCDAQTDKVLHLEYRALPSANPSFPRKGNLWGSWDVFRNGGLEHCKRIDLWLGAHFSEEQLRQLRGLNPNVLVLDSINTVERTEAELGQIPDDYWLKDVHGKKIEVWNGAYRLNLTKPEVAVFQAQHAYQRQLDAHLSMDGMFFDNFFTSQSWLDSDMWGNAVQVDANGDGKPDEPEWLDAAWRAGVYAELQAWRKLMPWAYASGHLPRPADAETAALFNGESLGFDAPRTKDGNESFARMWEAYQSWATLGRAPNIEMVESGVPFEIAYGYGYSSEKAMPAATLEFARTYYPYMRWGLGLTLMNDGYFAHEIGDAGHGLDWWYDELDHDLGWRLGPAARVDLGTTPSTDAIVNGGFEDALASGWTSWANASVGAAATFTRDASVAGSGSASCKIEVTKAGQGTSWHVALMQRGLATVKGTSYDLSFKARADAPHPVAVILQKGSSDWHGYGLSRSFDATADWQTFTVTFEATDTASDGRLSFNLGTKTGKVWIDDAKLVQHPPDVFRRDFAHGVVILNGTRDRQTISVAGEGLARLDGSQAPRYQYVVDDAEAGFTAGGWDEASWDSGQWVAVGPWYHDWGGGCHQSSTVGDSAAWDLGVRADDTYTLDAWWPAAPDASGWSSQVKYEVVVNGAAVATATVDQTQGGDQWHRIASVELTRNAGAQVRVTTLQAKPAIADAILVQSAARYNDGSDASSVELDAMDAIVLQRK